jgi:hypothetical protein
MPASSKCQLICSVCVGIMLLFGCGGGSTPPPAVTPAAGKDGIAPSPTLSATVAILTATPAPADTPQPIYTATFDSTGTSANTPPPAGTARPNSTPVPTATPSPSATSTLVRLTYTPVAPSPRPPTRTPVPPKLTPSPTSTKTPTAGPQSTVSGNPWGYNFTCCNLITAPPADFCSYFACISSFWNGHGHVEQCNDSTFSKTGGVSGSCSGHGGNSRPLYAP